MQNKIIQITITSAVVVKSDMAGNVNQEMIVITYGLDSDGNTYRLTDKKWEFVAPSPEVLDIRELENEKK